MVCQQCDIPICETVCPMHALRRDAETGAVIIDYKLCVGCKLCVQFCPFGGIGVSDETGKIIKCDFCSGDPMCVKFCQPEALQYMNVVSFNLKKRKAAAEKFSKYLKQMLTAL